MSHLHGQFDEGAEIEACERIWSLDDASINAELKRGGVDPDGLLHRLEASLGLPGHSAPELTGRRQPQALVQNAPPAPGHMDRPNRDWSCASCETSSVAPVATDFEIAGKMKFFDAMRGYGFFAADGEKGDVLVHVTHLQAAGYRTIYEGARLHALAQATAKGLQVKEILSIDEGSAVHPSQLPQRTREKVRAESEWVRAVVKWYNNAQGYGFVVEADSQNPDCFVHADVLRRWGMAPLWAGQIVEMRWGFGGKGRMVAEIRHVGAASGLPAVH